MTADLVSRPTDKVEMFSFGDPTPVLESNQLFYLGECWTYNKWYEPPIDLEGLAKSLQAAPHHSSSIYVKRNILVKSFVPHPLLSRMEFSRFALDFIVFGNAYLERVLSRTGSVLTLKAALAKYVRRGTNLDIYYYVPTFKDEHEFEKGSIYHLISPDVNQEVYGIPEYLSALNSAFLNESATLFRRKYYKNGSHAGFILYMTDAAQEAGDIDNMRQALRDAKGPGNFRNLFVYAPNGKKDGIQLIPVSEVAAKDDFPNIKNVTRDDQLAAHRVPAQLIGVVPNNAGGFGDVEKAARVFVTNELEHLQQRLKEVNDWLGIEVIKFEPYSLGITPTP
ncbi:MAG: phage portal protein [Agitococcus sp.]|nr:phage portal protein [Agitococcus sp.]